MINRTNRAKIEIILSTQEFIDNRIAELKKLTADGEMTIEEYHLSYTELALVFNHLQKLKIYLDPDEIQETN